jgi:hypothetical protein
MNETRTIVRRPARRRGRVTALAGLVAVALVVLAVAAPAALAGPRAYVAGGGDVVKAGTDVYVAPGQTVDSVTVFGGNADIAGTVRHTVVTIGGNVRIEKTAQVGTELQADDTSVVAIGGTVRTAPGAIVTGDTGAVRGVSAGQAMIAAAVAFVGVVAAGATLMLLAIAGLILTLAAIAGAIALVVWLVRRDDRRKAAKAYAAYTTTYAPPATA